VGGGGQVGGESQRRIRRFFNKVSKAHRSLGNHGNSQKGENGNSHYGRWDFTRNMTKGVVKCVNVKRLQEKLLHGIDSRKVCPKKKIRISFER